MEGLFGIGVDAFEDSAGIDIAAKSIKTAQQRPAVIEALQRDTAKADILQQVLVLTRPAQRRKRLVRRPEKTGGASHAPRQILHLGREADKGRAPAYGLLEFCHERTKTRPRHLAVSTSRVSGQAHMALVIFRTSDQRTKQH